ncbi:ubiquitin carboxyl-terminal hydrolase MINDY-2 [Trichonephila inaurata madagascariensis]|uniref:Ubiquitin carboxyl-terminal hydrolase n=1 Tax=Trichonephila inaurata madagascariensis TaxID=2747483 RepID=A0A8X6YXF6_9ARAC|nr:ubiquitin carboxyl-terminal hydrolase MINDY-2 [Trichonephila inaurata madagascariensis]
MATSVEDQVKSVNPSDSEITVGEEVTELSTVLNENINSVPQPNEPLACASTSDDNVENRSPVKEKSSVINDKSDSIYQIKWISRNGIKSPIITQNENGPCPLIAITNVLIMKGRITVPSLADFVTTENLMAYLGDCILESIPKNIPEGTQLNFEQNMHDAMAVLPKLQTGLDVNVKFTGISDFEYTPECIIFDLLRIPLYHGWLIDPQMLDVVSVVGTCSYNQLVEKIINSKCSLNPENVTEALIAENFLEKTASQLTYHGLCELTSKLKEDELCVLFRNNHFSSLMKHKNCLYQLVTDQGFVNENVVWETLNNIEGDGQFVDSDFIPVPPKSSDLVLPPDLSTEKQIDQDEELARRLQEEELKREENHVQEQQWQERPSPNPFSPQNPKQIQGIAPKISFAPNSFSSLPPMIFSFLENYFFCNKFLYFHHLA